MPANRHHPKTRLCAHSHNWIVRWLESVGWKKSHLYLPTRKQVLSGDPSSGYQSMIPVNGDDDGLCSVHVPGARTPELRLSLYEWDVFRRNLEAAYHLLGVSVPMMRNRLRRK